MAEFVPPAAPLLAALAAEATGLPATPEGVFTLLQGVMYLAVIATAGFVLYEKYRAFRDGLKKDDLELVKKTDLADYAKKSELPDLCVRRQELAETVAAFKERIGVIGDRQRETDEYSHKTVHELRDQIHGAQAKVDVVSILSEQQGRKLDHLVALMEEQSRRIERLTTLAEVGGRRTPRETEGERAD